MSTAAVCPPTQYLEIQNINPQQEGLSTSSPSSERQQLPCKRNIQGLTTKIKSVFKKKNGGQSSEEQIPSTEDEDDDTGVHCCLPFSGKKCSSTEIVPLKSSQGEEYGTKITVITTPETAIPRKGEGEIQLPTRGAQTCNDLKFLGASETQVAKTDEKRGLLLGDDSSLEDIVLNCQNDATAIQQGKQRATRTTRDVGFVLQNGTREEGQLAVETSAVTAAVETTNDRRRKSEVIGNKIKKTVQTIQRKLSKGTSAVKAPATAKSTSSQQEGLKEEVQRDEIGKQQGGAVAPTTAAILAESEPKGESSTESEEKEIGETKEGMIGDEDRSVKTTTVAVVAEETTLREHEEKQGDCGTKFTSCLKSCRVRVAHGAKISIAFVTASLRKVKRYFSSLKNRRGKKRIAEPIPELVTGTQETAIDRGRLQEREIWSSVSKSQLKALYATVAISHVKSPKEKLVWLATLHRLLGHKASRHDVNDRVRESAIEGNVVFACLKILEDATATAKAKQSMNESTMEAEDESVVRVTSDNLSIQPDDDNLSMTAIQVLHESALNDSGVKLFRELEGPKHVVERLNSWKEIQDELHHEKKDEEKEGEKEKEEDKEDEEEEGEEEKKEEEKEVLSSLNACRVVDTLKAVYGLLFATSGEVSDCSDKWSEAGIVEFPKRTLSIIDPESPFTKNSSYVGLALGTLRVLASRDLLLEQDIPELIDFAIEKLTTNNKNSWISENGLAFLALATARHPTIVAYIDVKRIDIWRLVVERCEEMQSEGHVLYQGLLLLKEACNADPDKIVPRVVEAGAVKLVESILPVQENKYVEHLITTAIKLKQLMSPYDFEKEELQSYIRSKNYHKRQQLVLELLPLMATESNEAMSAGDAKPSEVNKDNANENAGKITPTFLYEPSNKEESVSNNDDPVCPTQVTEVLSTENLVERLSPKTDFDG